MSDASMKIAYVAEGKLYVHERGGAAATLIDSPFVQSILDRAERDRERSEWRDDSTAWNLRAGGGFMGLGGMRPGDPSGKRRVHFTGVARAGDGQLVYSLDTDRAGGLFRLDVADKSETRIFHKHQFRARDLCRRASDGTLALSLRADDGTSHLAVMGGDGRGVKPLTEGDVVDEAPSWVGASNVLVYQSAGVGRNAAGIRVALGPYSVLRLDMDSGKVETLLDDEGTDYLSPRMTPDGVLYCVRRPYEPYGPAPSMWKVGLDILAFPYRVGRAIVHFLDYFSLVFASKPVITAAGPPRQGPDARYIMLWGKMVDAEKTLRQKDAQGAIVPRDWELIRREGGTETVVARNVVSFDLCADGGVVWTNGSAVYRLAHDKTQTELCKGKMIERVAVLG